MQAIEQRCNCVYVVSVYKQDAVGPLTIDLILRILSTVSAQQDAVIHNKTIVVKWNMQDW